MLWKNFSILCLIYGFLPAHHMSAQATRDYWQQEIEYKMDVQMDVMTNKFTGRQRICYKNNSPDILHKVFFHLYLNAFQPGSEMDVRSRTSPDADPRVADRILHLTPEEIGYQHIKKLTQNKKPLSFEVAGTILEVTLVKPILPGQSANFDMEYEAQVPLQIRRNGRDNREGIRYSMSQWYPKMCEYDKHGWHANPYIGREFYGVWGDFDVNITIDAAYTVAASGVLQNASEIGHGYAPEPRTKPENLTWKFKADKVHDFVWAADPEYIHQVYKTAKAPEIHTFYKETTEYKENWEALPSIMEEAFSFISMNFGRYPYPVYSFIQGGDGGMEYPMATLITGNRSLVSLVGVSVHELMHSWYQMVLGFNESYYYWMDEGFTDYAETQVTEHLKSRGLLPGSPNEFPYEGTYNAYKNLVERGIEEPLSTHADHFEYNTAYSIGAYIKGSVFLHQLEYVIGKPAFRAGMLDFFNTWKFKHPDVHDFIRIMEKNSGIELDWYKEYMVYTVKTIDYKIDTIIGGNSDTKITLSRSGKMPMPVDLQVKLKDGTALHYTIPLDIMRGSKTENLPHGNSWVVLPDWNWVNPGYTIEVPVAMDRIESVVIDHSRRLADLDRTNNTWPASKS